MVDNNIEYCELTTDEAVERIVKCNALYEVTIQNLRDLLERVKDIPITGFGLLIGDCVVLDCVCNRIEIPYKLTIHHTLFKNEVNFGGATFKKETAFSCVSFKEHVLFRCAVFEQGARFTWAEFERTADFALTQFKDNVSFYEAKLSINSERRSCFFDGSKIYGLCNFKGARFGKQTRINFSDVDIRPGGHILLSLNQIGKRQFFPSSSKRRGTYLIYGEDSEELEQLKSAAAQYNILRDNFRALPSKDEEEDRCHYKYKDLNRRATEGKLLWKIWDWAIMKWCLGYGIYTKRIIFAGLVLIGAFAVIYHFFADKGLIKNYDQEFNSLYFSVITFTTIGYGDYAPLGWLRVIAGAEGLLGLIVIAVFTVSFARKLIR